MFTGHALPQASKYLKMAGKGLNEYLRKLLSELGKTTFMTSVEMEVVRDIKEKLCYVAENFDKEMESFTEKQFKLPDGKVVSIGNECLRCPEALFQLSLAGLYLEDVTLESYKTCHIFSDSCKLTLGILLMKWKRTF